MKRLISSLSILALIASGAPALGAGATGVNYKGTVTQLTAGNGIVLTPNPITTTGTIAIDGSVVPQSGGSNTFTGDQTIIGNLTVGEEAAALAATLSPAATTSGNLTVTGDLTLGGSINGGLLIQTTDSFPNIYGGQSFSGVNDPIVGVTISGGANAAYDSWVTIGGGFQNAAGSSGNNDIGEFAVIGGGNANGAYGTYATIAGGGGNEAGKADGTAQGATVGGGVGNRAGGQWSAVPGGASNAADGEGSFAAGTKAHASFKGSFVWGDRVTDDAVTDTAVNQFVARTTGGATFYTCYNAVNHAFCGGATLAPGSGSWASTSDRELKANFAAVEGVEILQKLDRISIESWNYKGQDPGIRHMGPVAQDFRAAFGLGEDDKHISAVDADGVALAAVQGLYRLMREKDRVIEQQAAEIQQLKAGVESLRSEVRAAAASQGGDVAGERLAAR